MKNEEKQFIVILERKKCIGAAACLTSDPENWVMQNDGKIKLIGGKEENEEIYKKEITAEELERFKTAGYGCPVNAIHIIEKKTGKRII
ncbi:ferredoxin [Candidatus Woesearchaeota archaeon]|nr:ferredoxin [Candidatus Woesearchaeota archaeon]